MCNIKWYTLKGATRETNRDVANVGDNTVATSIKELERDRRYRSSRKLVQSNELKTVGGARVYQSSERDGNRRRGNWNGQVIGI